MRVRDVTGVEVETGLGDPEINSPPELSCVLEDPTHGSRGRGRHRKTDEIGPQECWWVTPPGSESLKEKDLRPFLEVEVVVSRGVAVGGGGCGRRNPLFLPGLSPLCLKRDEDVPTSGGRSYPSVPGLWEGRVRCLRVLRDDCSSFEPRGWKSISSSFQVFGETDVATPGDVYRGGLSR